MYIKLCLDEIFFIYKALKISLPTPINFYKNQTQYYYYQAIKLYSNNWWDMILTYIILYLYTMVFFWRAENSVFDFVI